MTLPSFRWRVNNKESGCTLLLFIYQKLEEQRSKRSVKSLIDQGCCLINGKVERFSSTPLKANDWVMLREHQTQHRLPEQKELDKSRILFEDAALLAYNKPAGIAADEELLQLLHTQSPTLALAHRLDRDTSGVILLAKTPEALETLLAAFRLRTIEKEYLALVDGVVESNQGIIKNFLGKRTSFGEQSLWGEVAAERGKLAITSWAVERRGPSTTLLRCKPKTGRTHQIRVHLAGMGHPILGDFLYCRQFKTHFSPSRCLLHAEKICFTHPTTQKKISLSAPLPEDFQKALEICLKNGYRKRPN